MIPALFVVAVVLAVAFAITHRRTRHEGGWLPSDLEDNDSWREDGPWA